MNRLGAEDEYDIQNHQELRQGYIRCYDFFSLLHHINKTRRKKLKYCSDKFIKMERKIFWRHIYIMKMMYHKMYVTCSNTTNNRAQMERTLRDEN